MLAEVILLDQFPRNVWRGTANAFAYDGKARAVARASGPAGTRRHRTTLFVSAIVLFTLGSATLMPHARAWKQRRDVESLLRAEPLFAALPPVLKSGLRGTAPLAWLSDSLGLSLSGTDAPRAGGTAADAMVARAPR